MTLTIPIDTIPAGRPRFFNGRAYDPPECKKFKADFALMILAQIHNHEIFTGAIEVDLKIYRNRKSATAKNFGDVDNLAKSILDAITMTGAVWNDDSQITDLHVTQATAPAASVEITIEEATEIETNTADSHD